MEKILNKYIFSLLIAVFILGCENKEEPISEIENPELVAVAFFDALYNEKNVKKAAEACTPKLKRIMLHYKSPNAVARHMFNMSFDTVVITPDDSGVKVREQFKEKATVTVYFEGTYNEDTLRDVKRLSLIQVDDKWLIDKILKDPF